MVSSLQGTCAWKARPTLGELNHSAELEEIGDCLSQKETLNVSLAAAALTALKKGESMAVAPPPPPAALRSRARSPCAPPCPPVSGVKKVSPWNRARYPCSVSLEYLR